MKKMNKFLKIIVIVSLLCMLLYMLTPIISLGWAGEMINKYDNTDYDGNASKKVTNTVGAAINVASIISAGIAIIMLIILGITYVLKSPEDKAIVKESLTRYIIGIVLMFGTSGILKIIQMFVDGNLNNI